MKEYKVELGGVETTIQLADEDARARGLLAEETPAESESVKAAAPANKARTAATK